MAHSHGGNIVKDYTWQEGARKIDTLITLGPPQRWDYRVNGSMAGTYLNVYSKYDNVQKAGGFNPWGAILGGILDTSGIDGKCSVPTGSCMVFETMGG